MLTAFNTHIENNFSGLTNQKILLAVSGGVDSMVLADLCLKSDFNISIAHCNFKLRGDESDADERFVLEFAKSNNLTVYSDHFDTADYVERNKLSVQMAARKLRYDFFDKLRNEHLFDAVLTAHHADDNLETFFINLSRGSGLDGLVGIPNKNKYVIRPLLLFTRAQILEYASENKLKWREDSSNASLYYQRNHLRHELMPALKAIYPSIINALQSTQNYLKSSQDLLQNHIKVISDEVIEYSNTSEKHYSVSALKNLNPLRSYIFPLFHCYGFTDFDELYNLIDAQTGKQIHSKTHSLLKDRSMLILTKKSLNKKFYQKIEAENSTVRIYEYGISLKLENPSELGVSNHNTLFLDADKVQFPLVLRTWKEGDYFYPSGMSGRKKMSKFFKDQKLSIIEKSKVLLLCSNDAVIWVLGMRSDARFLADKKTIKLLKINILNAFS
ncbi:tRNA lysidine(34) synthetase TilS [Flavobacteriaceae bacterium]|nr:tRNA lysidine(34) synthetase TilS [Flavobacteriaceae bacterium]